MSNRIFSKLLLSIIIVLVLFSFAIPYAMANVAENSNIFIKGDNDKSVPYNKALLILFYAQPLFYKLIYTFVLLLITIFLWIDKTTNLAKKLIRKTADFGLPATILNVGVAMAIYAVTRQVPSAMAAIAVSLMSSFIGYFIETSLEDLIVDPLAEATPIDSAVLHYVPQPTPICNT